MCLLPASLMLNIGHGIILYCKDLFFNSSLSGIGFLLVGQSEDIINACLMVLG